MRTTFALAAALALALSATSAPAAALDFHGGTPNPAVASGPGDAAPAELSPVAVGTGSSPTATTGDGSQAGACESPSERPPSDPPTDRIGWENGCRYDEPLAVTFDDGLNETELEAVVARTMARVERVRRLEFEAPVPVEIVTRSAYREATSGRYANVSGSERLHQNVKYETLFMVGEDTDAVAQLRENRGDGVLGYYDPGADRIVVVSEDEDTPQLDELTLAHELAHALQDQHFDITRYERRTVEERNAVNGLVEGAAHYVEYRYEQRCRADWECSTPDSEGGGDISEGFHWGLYFLSFQPYSDGPVLVKATQEAGGWEAVDDLYADPPASSEQVIHPEKYGDDEPANVTVADRSNDRWRVPDVDGGVDYAAFGEAGIYSMLYYPSYEAEQTRVLDYYGMFNFDDDGSVRQFDPLNYSHPYSDGWDGDRLYPYVTNDSAATNETGYVWKTVWDSEADAREFVEGYEQLLATRGAEPVDGHANTYRVPDDEPYGDAFYVDRDDDVVVVVNGPTVEELSEIRAGAAPESAERPSGRPPGSGPSGNPNGPETPTDEPLVPGASVPVAALVVAAAAVLLAWRRY